MICAAKGKRHPLPALLSLAVVAMLAGMSTYEAIVDYGKERGWEFLQLLGFTRRRGLCKATYSRVFRGLDVAAFEAAVSRWIRGRFKPGDAPHLAIDGKTLRGSPDGETPQSISCPLTPRMSKPSWPKCGSMPRPTN